MKGHSLMGHRGKVQKHLGERPICRSLERKGKQCFSRCRPVTLSWILAEGMWLDGVARFSTCLPVGHTLRVPPSGSCFLPVVKETAGTWLIKKKKSAQKPESSKAPESQASFHGATPDPPETGGSISEGIIKESTICRVPLRKGNIWLCILSSHQYFA